VKTNKDRSSIKDFVIAFISVVFTLFFLIGCQGSDSTDRSTAISYKQTNIHSDSEAENIEEDKRPLVDSTNEACLQKVYSNGTKLNDCVVCHVDGGIADATNLKFKASNASYNYTALKAYLEEDGHADTLINKISNSSSRSHFGGKFSANDVSYFQNFVDAYENQDACTLGTEDTTKPTDTNTEDTNTYNGNKPEDTTNTPITYLGVHTFQSKHTSAKCLEALGLPGTIVYSECKQSDVQTWKEDNLGRFHSSANTDYCLSADAFSNGAGLSTHLCSDTNLKQRWVYKDKLIFNGGYTIDLDVKNQRPIVYGLHGGLNQQWVAYTSVDNGNTDTTNTGNNTDSNNDNGTNTGNNTDTNTDNTVQDKEACMKKIYEERAEVSECLLCHTSSGIASQTDFILEDNGYESLKNYLDTSSTNGNYILSKITEGSGTSHFGGKFSDSVISFMADFSQAHKNQDSCHMSTGNGGSTPVDMNTDNGTDKPTDTEDTDNTDTPMNTAAPRLSLLGSDSINLTQGNVYIDPGYSAKDYLNKDIDVVVKGSVNTNVVGTYTLLYTATDKHAKVATATRSVHVIAKKIYEYFVDVRGQISANQSVIAPNGKIYKCKVAGWCNLINPNDDAYVPGSGRAWQDAWSFVGEGEAPVENKLPARPKISSAEYNYMSESIDIAWEALSKNTQKVQVLVDGVEYKEVIGYLIQSASIYGNFEEGREYKVSLIASNQEGESVSNQVSVIRVSLEDKGRENYNKDCKICHGTNGTAKADLTKWTQATSFAHWTKASNMPAAYTANCDDQCLESIGVYVKNILIPRSQNTNVNVSQDVVSQIPRGYRLLNSRQYKNTLESLFNKEVDESAIPLDNIVSGYNTDRDLNRVDEDKLKYFNEKAREYERYINNLKGSSSSACVMREYDFCKADKTAFVNTFARDIFRRPLSQSEKNTYLKLDSVGQIVGDMLVSPHFLYRSEMGVKTSQAGVYKFTQHEMATAIAYAISGTTPDDELLDLADRGALGNANTRITQAVRLSKLDTGKRSLEDFIGRWLLHDDVDSLGDKNLERFPGYSKEVKAAQSAQIAEFFSMVMNDLENSTYADLLVNKKWVTNKTLSNYYQEGTSNSSSFEVVPASSKRFGVLTLGAVASKYANSEEGHPFKRGDFVLSRMMCHEMGLPENGGDVSSIQLEDGSNTRERYSVHSNNASCVSCHQLLDPIGFVWEKYDGTGKFREKQWHPAELGGAKNIDTRVTLRGVLSFDAQESVNATEIRDLSELIANSDRGPECMAMQYYRYTSGDTKAILENNAVVKKIANDFKNEGYDLQALFNNIVGLESFITRQGE